MVHVRFHGFHLERGSLVASGDDASWSGVGPCSSLRRRSTARSRMSSDVEGGSSVTATRFLGDGSDASSVASSFRFVVAQRAARDNAPPRGPAPRRALVLVAPCQANIALSFRRARATRYRYRAGLERRRANKCAACTAVREFRQLRIRVVAVSAPRCRLPPRRGSTSRAPRARRRHGSVRVLERDGSIARPSLSTLPRRRVRVVRELRQVRHLAPTARLSPRGQGEQPPRVASPLDPPAVQSPVARGRGHPQAPRRYPLHRTRRVRAHPPRSARAARAPRPPSRARKTQPRLPFAAFGTSSSRKAPRPTSSKTRPSPRAPPRPPRTPLSITRTRRRRDRSPR